MSLIALFAASVIGSLHCAGMCGGFVAYYAGHSRHRWLSHLTYSLGRLLTYLVFGVIAGFAGRSVNQLGGAVGVQRLAAVLTGALLIYWGVRGLLGRKPELVATGLWHLGSKVLARLLPLPDEAERKISWPLRSFFIGLFSTLLPCTWLYSFVALAAASADPMRGVLVMLFFWAGTLPVMLSLGGVAQVAGRFLGASLPRVTAALLLAAGIFALSGHAQALLRTESGHCSGHGQ